MTWVKDMIGNKRFLLILAGVLIGVLILLSLFFPKAVGSLTMVFLLIALALGALVLRNEEKEK